MSTTSGLTDIVQGRVVSVVYRFVDRGGFDLPDSSELRVPLALAPDGLNDLSTAPTIITTPNTAITIPDQPHPFDLSRISYGLVYLSSGALGFRCGRVRELNRIRRSPSPSSSSVESDLRSPPIDPSTRTTIFIGPHTSGSVDLG